MLASTSSSIVLQRTPKEHSITVVVHVIVVVALSRVRTPHCMAFALILNMVRS